MRTRRKCPVFQYYHNKQNKDPSYQTLMQSLNTKQTKTRYLSKQLC